MRKSFSTKYGNAYNTSIEDFLDSKDGKALQGKVQLIFTSPPFPLVVPKKYGNKIGEDYGKNLAQYGDQVQQDVKDAVLKADEKDRELRSMELMNLGIGADCEA